MSDPGFAKCGCQHCGNHLEFPQAAAGQAIPCPHCGETTVLEVPAPVEASPEEYRQTPADLAGAFQGKVRRAEVPFFYQLGLALVAGVVVLLPVIYVALTLLAAYGVYQYATHFHTLLSASHGARVGLARLVFYVGPIVMGTTVVLFMIKPLFAGKPPSAQPLALNAEVEPVLFDFIARICAAVGAPMPNRIDLDCELNASASFRRGFLSLAGDDLVLTIGLPLVAGLNTRELAGVLAHEFGHFTQGAAMRLSYVVRRVNFWFQRVVYERDAWDVALLNLAEEAENGWIVLVLAMTRFGVWFTRLILKCFMYLGHAVSCFLMRQMEYGADHYEIQLAGSAAFESTAARVHFLGRALPRAYEALRGSWTRQRALPDHFPAFLLHQEQAMPSTLRAKLEVSFGKTPTGWLDTHPSDGDRLRQARAAKVPGIFQLELPASALFGDFDALARQITFLHYTDDLRLPALPGMLTPFQPQTARRPSTTPSQA